MIHRRHGFTLIEMMLAITLLGVFMLLASHLIGGNFDVARAMLTADSNSARFDHAVRALRADVFNSTSVDMPAAALLRIHTGAQVVEWHINQNELARTIGADHRTWDVGQPLTLKLDGAVVLLSSNGKDQIAMAPAPKGGSR